MLCTLIGAIILSINIQVGLNMHLYDVIGDASSSLRGSTSSLSVDSGLFLCTQEATDPEIINFILIIRAVANAYLFKLNRVVTGFNQ